MQGFALIVRCPGYGKILFTLLNSGGPEGEGDQQQGKVFHWSLVARKRDFPGAFFLLTFHLPPLTLTLVAVTMPSKHLFHEAFAQRPDIRHRILGAIGKLSVLIGLLC